MTITEYQIEDRSARSNFTMLPNCVLTWPGMTHSALRLYLWYKMVCGERSDGKCWTSLNTISEHCGMDRKTVIASRNKLAQIGLVKITKQKTAAGAAVVLVSIIDVWEKNREWEFPKHQNEGGGKDTLTEQKRSGKEPLRGGGKDTLGGVENNHPNKTAENNTKRELELSADADAAPSLLDDSLLFGKDEVVPKRETRHTRSARKLFEGLSKKRKVFREVNIDKWAAVFRSFMVETDITSEEFDETLAWYIEHAGEEFVPQAYSAGSFVEKFAKIRDQMLLGRNRLRGSSGKLSVSEQNEETKRIVFERIANGKFGTSFES